MSSVAPRLSKSSTIADPPTICVSPGDSPPKESFPKLIERVFDFSSIHGLDAFEPFGGRKHAVSNERGRSVQPFPVMELRIRTSSMRGG